MAYKVSQGEALTRELGIYSDEELNKNLLNDSYAADDTLNVEAIAKFNNLGPDGFNTQFGS